MARTEVWGGFQPGTTPAERRAFFELQRQIEALKAEVEALKARVTTLETP